MHGTQDAAAHRERKYTEHLVDNGFIRGKASPCVFWSPNAGVRCVVHGDDVTFAGIDSELIKCTKTMQDEYDVKVRGKLRPDKSYDKSMKILNRFIG